MKTEDGKLKFSFMEMITSGKSGCLSATGFLGVVCGLVMLLMFVALVVYYFIMPENAENIIRIIEQATIWFGMASALLGCRKITGMIGNKKGAQHVVISEEGVGVDLKSKKAETIPDEE